jgi:hypothetical protein
MGHENENNRSSAMTPELIAMITASTSAAVKEAMAGVAVLMGSMVKDLALTPEKLREANKPYVDPAVAHRALREKMKFKQEEIDNAAARRKAREMCPHKYKNGLASIGVVRNFPGNVPRGICVQCHEWFYPREWRISAPTDEHPEGVAAVVDMHPKYQLVWDAINQQEG